MGFNRSEESSEIIQAYLSYLQEMSRKISLRTGMENTLYGKTKKSYHHYRPFNNSDIDSSYLRNVKVILDKESDRQLFLGNGLILGSLKKQTKKYITAPLIYFLAKINLDEGGSLTCDIDWESASLNYDVITSILEQEFSEEVVNEEIEFQSAGIDTSKLESLEDIEHKLENIFRKDYKELITGELAVQLFKKIYKEISEFSQVNFSMEEFTLEKLNNLSKEQVGLTFYKHQFFYISSLPGQLSTYMALRKLILEVK